MKNNKKFKLERSESLVYDVNNHNWVNESINRLRDNVLYYSLDGTKKVIQVESSVSGEAKTTVCVNLAVALASSGKKVCVVDFDFRKPRVHRPFKIENKDGITDYLLGKIELEDVIKKTEFDNVWICNRGENTQNSSFVLTSEKINNFINQLKNNYGFDFILLDCPPVLIISDYIHISKFADGVIFNIAYGKTKKNQVKEAINLLKKNNVPIIGCVFTFYNPNSSYNSSEYYGYDKNYGYGDNN